MNPLMEYTEGAQNGRKFVEIRRPNAGHKQKFSSGASEYSNMDGQILAKMVAQKQNFGVESATTPDTNRNSRYSNLDEEYMAEWLHINRISAPKAPKRAKIIRASEPKNAPLAVESKLLISRANAPCPHASRQLFNSRLPPAPPAATEYF